MDYESFKEKFVEDVKDRLYEQGAEVDLSIHTVNKLNESYEAITVTPEGLLRSPRCPFVLYVGKKKLVKRKEFEKFISDNVEI